MATEEENEADGWGILHDRSALPQDARYESLYLVGPLPTKAIADLIKANMNCSCQKRVVPLFFPAGVTMMVTVPLPDIGMSTEEGPVH